MRSLERVDPSILTHALSELSEQGWTEIYLPYNVGLVDFARQFGVPVASRPGGALFDRIVPKVETEARANTMSSRFGLKALPYHTDGAYFRIPPRLLILRLAEGATSHCATSLISARSLRLSKSELKLLGREIWIVRQNRDPFYSSILCEQPNTTARFIRYDTCCMQPLLPSTNLSQHSITSVLQAAAPHNVHWTLTKAVIIDNWRVVHARQSATIEDQNSRVLERVLVTLVQKEGWHERLEV